MTDRDVEANISALRKLASALKAPEPEFVGKAVTAILAAESLSNG